MGPQTAQGRDREEEQPIGREQPPPPTSPSRDSQAMLGPLRIPYLFLLQPSKSLCNEPDVLAGQRGQLAILRPQVNILQGQRGGRGLRSAPMACSSQAKEHLPKPWAKSPGGDTWKECSSSGAPTLCSSLISREAAAATPKARPPALTKSAQRGPSPHRAPLSSHQARMPGKCQVPSRSSVPTPGALPPPAPPRDNPSPPG